MYKLSCAIWFLCCYASSGELCHFRNIATYSFKLAVAFVKSSTTLASQSEKATLVALIFSAASLMNKAGDASTNLGMGLFLAALVHYMGTFSGSTPFLHLE
jgi:hypothetical protein